jgi:hypothetical protein
LAFGSHQLQFWQQTVHQHIIHSTSKLQAYNTSFCAQQNAHQMLTDVFGPFIFWLFSPLLNLAILHSEPVNCLVKI